MPPSDLSPIRTRGPLELRSDDTILLHGHAIEAVGLTTDPTQLQVRTAGNSQFQPLASSDFLYVVTGLERMPEEQAQRLFKAYLLVRAHLSELVEISTIKQEIHPACLVLLLHTQSEPFFASVSQANAWLADLRQVPPLQARAAAQLFAACLITTSRLEAMLDAFEQAQLGPFVSQIAEGQAFLDIASRAREIVERITSIIRAEEPQKAQRAEPSPQRRPDALSRLLLALLGLCACCWLSRGMNTRRTCQQSSPDIRNQED